MSTATSPGSFWLRGLRALIVKEFLQVVRDPSTYLIAGVLPVLFLLLFGFGITLDPRELKIAVVDEDRSAASCRLTIAFDGSPHFRVAGPPTLAESEDAMRRGAIQGILRIQEGYGRDVAAGRRPHVQLLIDGTEPNIARHLSSYGSGVIQRDSQTAGPTGVVLKPPLAPEPRIWFNADARSVNCLVPGSIVVVMTLIGTLLTSLVIAREWERGTMEAMLATPVTRLQMLLGKLIPYYVLGMFSMGLCTITAVTLFDVPFRGSLGMLVLLSSVFMACALGQGLFISAALRVQLVAAEAGLFSGFLPALLLSGFVFDIGSMPTFLQYFTCILPARWFNTALRSAFLAGDNWELMLPCIAVMLLQALVLLGAAWRKLSPRVG